MNESKASTWLTAAATSTTTAKTQTTVKTQEQSPPQEASETLPLAWTRIGDRKRARVQADDEDWNRCCGRQGCRHVRTIDDTTSSNSKLLRRRYSGRVVFCLHESDPLWFQGYFFPTASSKPWGLLATRRSVDDCLACAEGGYRVIDLQVNCPNKKKHKFPSVEWTGADMMVLKSPHVSMRTERLSTCVTAAEIAQKLFSSLFRKARQEQQQQSSKDKDTTENDDALELFPDICVVAGNMDLSLPIDDERESELYQLMFND